MNFNFLLILLFGVLSLLLQAHPFFPFSGTGIRPDLLFCIVVFTGVNSSLYRGAVLCFLFGYLIDILSGANSGLYTVIYLNVFILIKILQNFFCFETLPELVFLFVLFVVLKFIILYFFFYYISEYSPFVLEKNLILETLYTLLFFPFIYQLLFNCCLKLKKR